MTDEKAPDVLVDGKPYRFSGLRVPDIELTVLAKDESEMTALIGDGDGRVYAGTLEFLEDVAHAGALDLKEPRRTNASRVIVQADATGEVELVPPLRRRDDGTPMEGVVEHGAVAFDLLTLRHAGMEVRVRFYDRHWYVQERQEWR